MTVVVRTATPHAGLTAMIAETVEIEIAVTIVGIAAIVETVETAVALAADEEIGGIVETVEIVATAEETEEIAEIVETVVAKAQAQVVKQAATGVEIGSARNATPTTLLDEMSASSVARRSLEELTQTKYAHCLIWPLCQVKTAVAESRHVGQLVNQSHPVPSRSR